VLFRSLAEFRVASALVTDPNPPTQPRDTISSLAITDLESDPQEILSKLTVVDKILARYKEPEPAIIDLQDVSVEPKHESKHEKVDRAAAQESMFSKTSFIPRSLLQTGARLNRDFKPNSEAEVIKEYQLSRFRTRKSIQFLAILIIIPILTQQVSKNFIFSPLFDYFHHTKQIQIVLNSQQQREAIEEVEMFEKTLKFEQTIGKTPRIPAEEYEKMVTEKTMEVAQKYSQDSSDALENIFADLTSAAMFAWILIINAESVRILKSFIDELVYGLSDSAKAFVIILFTDVFVGFHSSHGWEIAIEGLLRHFGLPENRDFIFLFIATFPVALDSLFKYWIFRYLSRISPSAVATYRNMNEWRSL